MQTPEFTVRGAVAALWTCRAPRVLLDGPGRSGKTLGILLFVDMLCRRWPGTRVLLCRQTRNSLSESVLQTFEEHVLGPRLAGFGEAGRANRNSYDYANGSTIVLGGVADHPERMYSTEWDIVCVFEAIEVTQDAYERFGRGMSGKHIPLEDDNGNAVTRDGMPVYRTQIIMDTNPAAPAHWLNRLSTPVPPEILALDCIASPRDYERLTAWNERRPEVLLDDPPREGPTPIHRLLSRHQDNSRFWDLDRWRWTPDGQAVVLRELAGMTGHRRARLFEGRWVAAEGSVFGAEFVEARNVCKPFRVPDDWPIWTYGDPGYDHPFGVFWLTISPTQRRYVIGTLYERQTDVEGMARLIKAREHAMGWKPITRYLDPRYGFAKTAFAKGGTTIADAFHEHGLEFYPYPALAGPSQDAAVNAVRQGFTSGMLVVFADCVPMINEIQAWAYKRNASGEQLSGDDQYEDRNNDLIDPLIGSQVTAHRFEDGTPAYVDPTPFEIPEPPGEQAGEYDGTTFAHGG